MQGIGGTEFPIGLKRVDQRPEKRIDQRKAVDRKEHGYDDEQRFLGFPVPESRVELVDL